MNSLTALLAIAVLSAAPADPNAPESIPGDPPPVVLDKRLKLELFAASPDIVTPTGLTVDQKGRVLVIENHTHFPPEGYQGPKHDRIRMFVDTNGDDKADKITTFYEGTTYTMNLAVYRDGSVFVATRSEIFRLFDDDEDGKAERKLPIARLETKGNYPHNGLSGFAFDHAGNVYFGFGENLGADYKLIGTDGVTLSGGEGGKIYRCRADGSQLEIVAGGFWNPFHVSIDSFGRLFTVDNDPDSRPPCRLLHVVEQGDYGYRFRNGRKGLHPFTAWNGELPGTLPMSAGTGEAPSGVLAYESDLFPSDYRGDLLVTSWGDHRIERFRLSPRGASLGAEMTPVVRGGENFRPVGIATAPDGSVYISDWVDRSYNVHGKGAIWRLSATPTVSRPAFDAAALASPDRPIRERAARRLASQGEKGRTILRETLGSRAPPQTRALCVLTLSDIDSADETLLQAAQSDADPKVRALAIRLAAKGKLNLMKLAAKEQPAVVRAAAIGRITGKKQAGMLLAVLDEDDPFLRQAARLSLQQSGAIRSDFDLASLKSGEQRLGVALLLRAADDAQARAQIPALLADPDPRICFVAIQWIGESVLTDRRDDVNKILAERAETRQLFEACLASLERLDGKVRTSGDEWSGGDYVIRLVKDKKLALAARRRALRMIRADHPQLTADLLSELLGIDNKAMRLEAIRSLRESPLSERDAMLAVIAKNGHLSDMERAEAVVGLAANNQREQQLLVDLAIAKRFPKTSREALRSLRGVLLEQELIERLKVTAKLRDAQWRELAARVSTTKPALSLPPAEDLDSWEKILQGKADSEAGERIFFHTKTAACFRCHEISGRGGSIGPTLTSIGRSMTRRRLIESILQPSKEMAPHFIPWNILTTDGKSFTGLYLGQDNEGMQRYADSSGKLFRIAYGDVEERRASGTSIMPTGLTQTMTLQEIRDLLAFILQTN